MRTKRFLSPLSTPFERLKSMAQKPASSEKLPINGHEKGTAPAPSQSTGSSLSKPGSADSLDAGEKQKEQPSPVTKSPRADLKEPAAKKLGQDSSISSEQFRLPGSLSAAQEKAFKHRQAFFFVEHRISEKAGFIKACAVAEQFESDRLPSGISAFYTHRFSEKVFYLGKVDEFDSGNHPLLTYIFQANADDAGKSLLGLHENYEARAVCFEMFSHGIEVEKNEQVAAEFLSTIPEEARRTIFGRVLFHALDEGHLGMVKSCVDLGAGVRSIDEEGHFAVSSAMYPGLENCLEYILSAGFHKEDVGFLAEMAKHAAGNKFYGAERLIIKHVKNFLDKK